jgi:transposase InsO family protein
LSEILKIAREWNKQGCPGSRPVIYALPHLRVRLIREVIAALKRKKRKRSSRIQVELRVSLVVHDHGTVTAMDAAAMKKGEDFIVTKDRGSLRINTSRCKGSIKSEDAIAVLTNLKSQNKLPLVLCSDNGSPFVSKKVKVYLSENKVIHLKSMPHVPQHNGAAESAVKDVKLLARNGVDLDRACEILNTKRLRKKLNYKTSEEVEQQNFKHSTQETRAEFFEAACEAINVAVLGIECAHEKRKAERKAIFETMERFSLITINRGLRHA